MIPRPLLGRVLADIALPFLGLGALALASGVLGIRTLAYLKINLALALLFLPGWLLTRRLPTTGTIWERFYLGTIIAFALYATQALVCPWLGIGFGGFYAVHLIACVFSLALAWRTYAQSDQLVSLRALRPAQFATLLALGTLLILLYRLPFAVDCSQFYLQIEDMALRRDFAVSNIGVSSFGIEEPMPRWRAHLLHALHALLVDCTRYDPRAVSTWLTSIPFGFLLMAALFYFARAVVGPTIHHSLLILAILGPFTLFHVANAFSAYHYFFRFLNAPGLDKDFTAFYVLPSMLYLSIRYTTTGSRAYLGCLLGLTAAALYFHPFTPVYFLLGIVPLAAAYGWRQPRRVRSLAAYALTLLLAAALLGNAQDSHDAIEALIRHDHARGDVSRYWYGQYTCIPGTLTDSITWKYGTMFLRRSLLLNNSLIYVSLLAVPVWILILARTFLMRRAAVEELCAFRMQLAYMGLLAAIWGLAPLFLYVAPYWWRGYERLHWCYFGFFPVIYVGHHLLREGSTLLERLGQPARRAGVLAVYLVFLAFLGDQSLALFRQRASLTGRLPGLCSVVDSFPRRQASKHLWHADAPDWLRRDDVVLCRGRLAERLRPDVYWLQRQGAYWPELFVEAFVYARKGESFLLEREAYYDSYYEKLTPRLVDWLRARGVTVLACFSPAFVEQLAQALGGRCQRLDDTAYRLELPELPGYPPSDVEECSPR